MLLNMSQCTVGVNFQQSLIDVLLTVHLSIILATDQPNVQILVL
jgi:hypothetical protein